MEISSITELFMPDFNKIIAYIYDDLPAEDIRSIDAQLEKDEVLAGIIETLLIVAIEGKYQKKDLARVILESQKRLLSDIS